MIKKILLATLLAGTAVSPCAVQAKPAIPVSHEVIKLTSEEETNNNLISPVTNVYGKNKELADGETEFKMNGFNYTKPTSSYKITVLDPDEAKDFGFLFLSRDIYLNGTRTNVSWNSSYNFENYTNVRDVIINNSEYSKMASSLSTFDHDINLFLSGKLDLSEFDLIHMTNVKNVVFSSTIGYPEKISADATYAALRSSSIEHIYFASWIPNVDEVMASIRNSGKSFKNKNDQEISFEIMPEDSIIYDKAFFTPLENMPEENHYGFKGYYYSPNSSDRITSLSSVNYRIANVDPHIHTLIYNTNITSRPYIEGNIDTFVTNFPLFTFPGHVNNYYNTDVESTSLRIDNDFSMDNLYLKGSTAEGVTPSLQLSLGGDVFTTGYSSLKVQGVEDITLNSETIPASYIDAIKQNFEVPTRNVLSFDNKLIEVENPNLDVSEHVRMLNEMKYKNYGIHANATVEANYQAFKVEYPGDTSVPGETETPTPSTNPTTNPTTPTTNPTTPSETPTQTTTNTGNNDYIDPNIYVEEPDEFQEGLHVAGSLVFSNNYTIRQAVNIAVSKMLWEDKDLINSTAYTYEIKAYPVTQELSITVKQNGSTVKSGLYHYKSVESTKKFVYCSSGYYGTLQIDLDSTTYNPKTLYQTVLGQYVQIYSGADFRNFNMAEASQTVVHSILKHQNGKYYEGILNVSTADIDNITNNNLTYSETEEVTSVTDERLTANYQVLDVTDVYIPPYLNEQIICETFSDIIVRDNNGDPLDKTPSCFIYKEQGHDIMYVNFGDVILKKQVNIHYIETSYKMGFVKISNGDILVDIPYRESAAYTNAKVKSELESFIKNNLEIDNPQVQVPESLTSFTNTKYYDCISYANGNIKLQTCGIASLLKSTRDNPITLDAGIQGKRYVTDIYFSDDYSIKEVMDVIMDKLFYIDGMRVKYEAKYSVLSNDYISISIYQKGEFVNSVTFKYNKVPSQVGSFIYAGLGDAYKGMLLIEQGKNKTTFNQVFNFLLQHLSNTTTNSVNQNVDMSTPTRTTVNGVLHHLNYNYYSYSIDVKVINYEQEKAVALTYSLTNENNEVVDTPTENKPVEETNESFGDKVKGFFENFKTKFEENNAFKAGMIAVGSILGLAILFGIYLLIRKLYRWLRR